MHLCRHFSGRARVSAWFFPAITPLTDVMESSMPASAVQRLDPLLIPAALFVFLDATASICRL
jgi:hypothetical protein